MNLTRIYCKLLTGSSISLGESCDTSYNISKDYKLKNFWEETVVDMLPRKRFASKEKIKGIEIMNFTFFDTRGEGRWGFKKRLEVLQDLEKGIL